MKDATTTVTRRGGQGGGELRRTSELVNQELDDDRRYHPNLGGITSGGMANHYPMTLLALSGLGASDAEIFAFKRSWLRHRASSSTELGLLDRQIVTTENWGRFLGQSEYLLELRRVFGELLEADRDGHAIQTALRAMRDGLPMGLFHPVIRLSFAVAHGSRGLVADALAYMAIRHEDMFRQPELDARRPHVGASVISADEVWRRLPRATSFAPVRLPPGGSLRICEQLCADAALAHAALPEGFEPSASVPEICRLALRLYLASPALTTLHAVTAAQALAELSHTAAGPALWTRYWIWLTALYLEKGRLAALPVADVDATRVDPDWGDLIVAARASREVHLIKMAYSCRWLDEAFGPEPLYRIAVFNMLREQRAHPRHRAGLASAAL